MMDSKSGTRIDNSLRCCVLFSNYGDPGHAMFVASTRFAENRSIHPVRLSVQMILIWFIHNWFFELNQIGFVVGRQSDRSDQPIRSDFKTLINNDKKVKRTREGFLKTPI